MENQSKKEFVYPFDEINKLINAHTGNVSWKQIDDILSCTEGFHDERHKYFYPIMNRILDRPNFRKCLNDFLYSSHVTDNCLDLLFEPRYVKEWNEKNDDEKKDYYSVVFKSDYMKKITNLVNLYTKKIRKAEKLNRQRRLKFLYRDLRRAIINVEVDHTKEIKRYYYDSNDIYYDNKADELPY